MVVTSSVLSQRGDAGDDRGEGENDERVNGNRERNAVLRLRAGADGRRQFVVLTNSGTPDDTVGSPKAQCLFERLCPQRGLRMNDCDTFGVVDDVNAGQATASNLRRSRQPRQRMNASAAT
jgi:hypothetical protein